MPDETVTLRGIHWREVLPFTHLFRAFRVAIHPSKIVLALAALLLLYGGGRSLDAMWPAAYRAVPNEVSAFDAYRRQGPVGGSFADYRSQVLERIHADYADQLMGLGVASNRDEALRAAATGKRLDELKSAILRRRKTDVAAAADDRASVSAGHGLSHGDVKAAYEARVQAAYADAVEQYRNAKRIENLGLFDQYFSYEANQIASVVRGVREWNWFGEERLDDSILSRSAPPPPALTSSATSTANPLGATATMLALPAGNSPAAASVDGGVGLSYGQPGVIQSVTRFFAVGPVWLLSQHPLFFLFFGLWFLVLWAIFGGAIARITAVHVARDEKMSIRSALVFSVGKFLSFLFAPIIPVIIIVLVGLLVSVGALLGNIPVAGPILIGVMFPLVMIAAFVMALVSLGLIGGFNLMYPTIAVEGSDSFDAISRSFSYLYARPWRLALYTAVAVVYGAVTYLFVRLFIYVMLVLAHKFVGIGFFLAHADSTGPLWPTMWPSPTTAARLSYDIDTLTLGPAQATGAFLVSIWVYLAIAVLGAFAISFYFSANTIIYYLMRQEVDATEPDEVFLDPVDDEFAEVDPEESADPTAGTPAPAAASVTSPPSVAATAPAATQGATTVASPAAPVATQAAGEDVPPPT